MVIGNAAPQSRGHQQRAVRPRVVTGTSRAPRACPASRREICSPTHHPFHLPRPRPPAMEAVVSAFFTLGGITIGTEVGSLGVRRPQRRPFHLFA